MGKVEPALRKAQSLAVDSWRMADRSKRCQDLRMLRWEDWEKHSMVEAWTWHFPGERTGESSGAADIDNEGGYGWRRPKMLPDQEASYTWPPLFYQDRSIRIA